MTSQYTKKLMEHRDDVNYQGDIHQRIPLHVHALLEHDSDVDYSAKIGEVPLHSVTQREIASTENVTNLLQNGNDISCLNNCLPHHSLYNITDPGHAIHSKLHVSIVGYVCVCAIVV